MIIDPRFAMLLSLHNITGITSSTIKFKHNLRSQRIGYFGFIRRKFKNFKPLNNQAHIFLFAIKVENSDKEYFLSNFGHVYLAIQLLFVA